MQVIIFDNGLGGVDIITPAPKNELTIEQLADKRVPSGASFEIVDDSTLPWGKPRELWVWE